MGTYNNLKSDLKNIFNPLLRSVQYMARLAKIFDLNLRRYHQKNFL